MHVESIEPTVQASGTKRLTRQHDEPLSTVAFKFNLRRYNQEVIKWAREHGCRWDFGTRHSAVKYGHLELVTWLDAHGAPH